METPEDEYMTVGEIAAVLRVTPMTVYRLIQNGKLTAIQIGRQYRVPTVEVRRIKSEGTS